MKDVTLKSSGFQPSTEASPSHATKKHPMRVQIGCAKLSGRQADLRHNNCPKATNRSFPEAATGAVLEEKSKRMSKSDDTLDDGRRDVVERTRRAADDDQTKAFTSRSSCITPSSTKLVSLIYFTFIFENLKSYKNLELNLRKTSFRIFYYTFYYTQLI